MPQKISAKEKRGLNEQQLQMLNLFKMPMAEEDYNEIRRAVVRILAGNVDIDMEQLEKERGWNEETYKQWGKEHMRTPYKP